ncbi:thiamine pyrophosphate-binding protein [Immundisolibacter sp.]|uniref:thiamine pyrophosphate-binding protein n=1 Tax=Immundisolibacter sp. TaxID=1934948 RepID=UPI002634115D|nr:thiamine pyrophosphate-binding protein [Immundisolibacter sp.]MDD3651133.1 thiamine pyrophosphate-binding protein [Immundisolibacter sp.]
MQSTDNTNTTPAGASIEAAPMEGGDLIVHYLQQIGVEYVFGVPGGAIEPLVNAIARGMRRGGPKLVVARHESGAAFMADGYARETGKLGVCFATTGPGATNMITGVASAHQDGIPLLAITAQTKLENFGRGGLQESSCTAIDTIGIYKHITKYNTLISHQNQLERKLIKAILSAFQQPCGAVHLSVPLDITRAITQPPSLAPNLADLIKKPSTIDRAKVEDLYAKISGARKICFLLGEGARGAVGRILALALRLDAPVLTTPYGKGLISPFHRQFRGVIGMGGHRSALATLNNQSVDYIIAVGTSFGEFATGSWPDAALHHRLIHVDANPEHFHGSHMAQLHILGDPLAIFNQIDEFLGPSQPLETTNKRETFTAPNQVIGQQSLSIFHSTPNTTSTSFHHIPNCSLDDPEKYLSDASPIKPQRLMGILPRVLPAGTRFIADGTGANFWAIHYLHIPDRRIAERRSAADRRNLPMISTDNRTTSARRRTDQRQTSESLFRCPGEFGSMGWGLGAAIGTALGSPDMPVVVLTGDGSMLMNGQEMTVALQKQLCVIFVVMNDSALGTVKHGQRLSGAEPIGFDLPEVNFAAMAQAMGINACRIQSPTQLISIDFFKICQKKQPYLIDVLVDTEEVPPLGGRMKALEAIS